MLAYKKHHIEVRCDLCQTEHLYEEGVDYYDFKDVQSMLEAEGWKSLWSKPESKYITYCKECREKQLEKFNKLKAEVQSNLYSLSDSKYLSELLPKT